MKDPAMIKKPFAVLGVALCGAVLSGAAWAADAQPPADLSKPVTTVRIGGSPADAVFRDAQQKSAAAYRKARDACRAKPRAERSACMKAARTELDRAHAEAKAARDEANRSQRQEARAAREEAKQSQRQAAKPSP